jgi:hypothetical protein
MKPSRIGKIISLFVIFVILISSFGCDKKDDFNIVGNWRIRAVSSDGTMDEDYFLSFQGDEWSGDIYESGVDIGDYIVFNKTVFIRNVAFSLRYLMGEPLGYQQLSFGCEVHSGHDIMNGSFSSYYSNLPQAQTTGTWNGTRQ